MVWFIKKQLFYKSKKKKTEKNALLFGLNVLSEFFTCFVYIKRLFSVKT